MDDGRERDPESGRDDYEGVGKMATEVQLVQLPVRQPAVTLPMYSGDRLTQQEFHRRYEQYPDNFKFELIGGVVYMASPTGFPHGNYDGIVGMLLGVYATETEGTDFANNATVILANDSEPQPDHVLFVRPEFGGRTSLKKEKFLAGPPELVAEIAHSSVSIDLHGKKDDYRRAGVLEYIVVCVAEKQVRWFDLTVDQELKFDEDRVVRSRVFPGLWIDSDALIQRDTKRLLNILQQCIATQQHQDFVKGLKSRK